MKIIRSAKIKYIPASHEDPKNPNVIKKVLLEKQDFIKGQIQMINWAKLLPGKTFVPHYHQDMQEVFILLNGKAKMKIYNEEEIMQPGDVVVVPIQAIHTMKNETNQKVEYIVLGIATEENGKTITLKK